ncbi:hypothetical protein NE237_004304 [Protea cynaroides]|uniref:Uncharacterized protein n=1 Tax=Protea cynaroides TaxID=273540 RepID=A0A9Q0QTF7_9MAGN|nr:hypothetical protein NE237_004304 [Protea cynaroides]
MSTCWCRHFSPGGAEHLVLYPNKKLNHGMAIPMLPIHQRRGIILRSKRVRIVESTPGRGIEGVSIGSEGVNEGNCRPRLYAALDDKSSVVDGDEEVNGQRRRRQDRVQTLEVVVAATATVVLGVGNRVLNKLALVPLKHHPFFLAQLATFG